LEPFSQTWPSSGTTRHGTAYALPTSAHLTADSVSSSSPGLLPTPTASDRFGAGVHGDGGADLRTTISTMLPTPTARDGKGHNQRRDDTCLTGALLPTPRATDGTKGGPNQCDSSGDLMLPSAVQLLPTPVATAYGTNQSPSPGAAVRPSLEGLAPRLLATPRAQHGESRNQTCWRRPMSEPQNLENQLARLPGVLTPPQSDGGSES
jgi:hypothetical protein